MIAGVLASRKPVASSRFVCDEQVSGYEGDIWISIHPMKVSDSFKATLLLGSKINRQRLEGPISLITGEGKDDSPLFVDVQPPATVTCGFGTPPDQGVKNIKPDGRPMPSDSG